LLVIRGPQLGEGLHEDGTGDPAGPHRNEEVGEIGERGAARLVEDEEQGRVASRHAVARAGELLDEVGRHEPEERPQVSEPRLGDLEVNTGAIAEQFGGHDIGPAHGGEGHGGENAVAAGDEGSHALGNGPEPPWP
jgi:hypothetical protein